MATASFNLDNSAVVWSTQWSDSFQAANTDQNCRIPLQAGAIVDFSFLGSGCQITCATNGTAPVINYNLDSGGWTALGSIPTSGALALVNVGGQSLTDDGTTVHTMRLQNTSTPTTSVNFWWQVTGGITITSSHTPTIQLSTGTSQHVYNFTTADGQRNICLDGSWVPYGNIPTLWVPAVIATGQDAGLRFIGNPTDIKLFTLLNNTARVHLYQDGVDLGFVSMSNTALYDWFDVVPSGVTLDGATHTYEIRFTQAVTTYTNAIMLIGGDITSPAVWKPQIVNLGDSLGYNHEKLIRGKTGTITVNNGATTVSGTGFSTLSVNGVSFATGQFFNTTNLPTGPWYKITTNTNTSFTIAPAYAGANYTGPGYFSDWTTTNDTAQGFMDLTARALGYGDVDIATSGQPVWYHHATSGLEQTLPQLQILPHTYHAQIGAVIVTSFHNDAKYSQTISSIATFSGGTATQITTAAAMTSIANGQTVQILGATGNTAINGTWTISNVSGATFVIPVAYSAGYTASSALAHRPTLDLFSAAATRVLNALIRAYGEVPIIVCGLGPNGSYNSQVQAAYNSAISTVCTTIGSPLVFADMTTWYNGTSGTVTSNTTDGTHLNEWGHYLVSQQLQALLPAATAISGGGSGRRKMGVIS
jgi:hypothetical protein